MSSVDAFLEKLQGMSPTSRGSRTFEQKRAIEKIWCSFPGAFGKYQLLPINSTINNFPLKVLHNTREINIPRKNLDKDGTETTYNAWIKLLPESAYTIKDPSTGHEVSSLTAADEALLRQAYTVWEELYKELDAYENRLDPNVGKLIRRKNYSIFHAYGINMWANGDTRQPARQNFSALFVLSAKGFPGILENAITDTNITSGMGNAAWITDIYNRETSGRKGFMMLSVNKADGPGFAINVSHQLGAEQFLAGVNIPEEDMELMQNPVETFLGWQGSHVDEELPPSQRRLFNAALIRDAIDYMTTQIAKIKMAKQNGTDIGEAIQATNQLILSKQVPTDTHGVTTNDPVLAKMADQAASVGNPGFGTYGNQNVAPSPALGERNTDPFKNPPAAHLDPMTGMPVTPGQQPGGAAPFTKPAFAGGNGSNDDLPF